ncbi:hypothetical protein M9B42_00650 [SAR86 cluster bacterium]|nr:hypothetical protein M9B42_00650 [SAR86 cluster bacterium]
MNNDKKFQFFKEEIEALYKNQEFLNKKLNLIDKKLNLTRKQLNILAKGAEAEDQI